MKRKDIKWSWVLEYMKGLGYDLIEPVDLKNKDKNPYWYCFTNHDFVFTKDGVTCWKLSFNDDGSVDGYSGIYIQRMMSNGYSCNSGRNVFTIRQFKNDINI